MKPHQIFYPFALLYGAVAWIRNWCFDVGVIPVTNVGVPVISVGNITAGGSGKTPMVIKIGKILLDAGKKIAVVSRGYGRTTKGMIVVSDGDSKLSDSSIGGDEPVLIASNLPGAIVIVDENRVRAARTAMKQFGADVIILDDGFQHRYLARTLDIVLCDARRLPFDTPILPAGYRREQVSSLRRSHCVVVTKAIDREEAMPILNRSQLSGIDHKFSSSYQSTGLKNIFTGEELPGSQRKDQKVIAVSGIADPDSFHNEIEKIGFDEIFNLSFPDHHRYIEKDIETIRTMFRNVRADMILTTEKDAVKLKLFSSQLSEIAISVVMMDVQIHQKSEFEELIRKSAHKI